MNIKIYTFLINYLEDIKEINLPEKEKFNYRYLDNQHIDSFGLIQFIMSIEDEYDIQVLPEDTESDEFRYIGGLVTIIENKIN